MLHVQRFYCIGGGVPALSERTWLPIRFREVVRDDPFTGKTITVPTWVPDDAKNGGDVAAVYGRVDLVTSPAWAPAARALEGQSAALHDGMLFELWTVIVGQADAEPAWKPAWVTTDGLVQIIEFPTGVTAWLATASEERRQEALSQWIGLPYLENAAGASARMVGECVLAILAPLANAAMEYDAKIVAEASEYVLP